ncbi:peptidoglycan DD-metalloendopeptidase family protein [Colwellia echini]|uniref:Peptidoglycan DD-metalloendopeptidase family protein n=1 Tax=Colwellia echini TaxID=1982103 RepID=A0ABY3MXI8_9GAMM|nr:peptidoglycan DD-metalloendopeptidase family protein [Colwellia echini]TYK65920.1 peptidoglycan DD-metalloendopeptidase family protein [Colwellia echini]
MRIKKHAKISDKSFKEVQTKNCFKAFVDRKKNILLCLLATIVLFSCSSRNTPAPVSTIYGSGVIAERNKNEIKTSQYSVKKGDTLYSIAWRSNSDVRNIAQLNKLTSPYRIFPGQNLFLTDPNSQKTTKVSKAAAQHKKSNKSSTQANENSPKNTLASTKKQAYGKNVSKVEIVQEPLPTSNFSKKIKQWQWPVNGKIIEYFSNGAQGNKGIDIAGSRGTEIRSAASGKVVYAGSALRGYGKLVIIKHNDDYLSAYAHNDRILVKEQQLVNVGDIIAQMGDTDTNKVMLHFEIRFRGKSVNPLKYLPKK